MQPPDLTLKSRPDSNRNNNENMCTGPLEGRQFPALRATEARSIDAQSWEDLMFYKPTVAFTKSPACSQRQLETTPTASSTDGYY